MLVEHELLKRTPQIRNEIVRLIQADVKMEPAFARFFGLEGDPYEALISLDKEIAFIEP